MPDDEEVEQPSTRPFWSGTISFGLVSIPVELYAANRSSHVGLRMLSPEGAPLRRHYYSSQTGKELAPEQMVRGYEIEKDKYVVVTDEELERLEPEKSQDIDLRRFVNKESIPPLYFERGYFLAPAEGSTKAYQLLAAVMEKSGRAGIATFVMRGKEYLTAIVAENGILRAETMRFKDEVRTPEYIGLPEKREAPAQQVQHFEKLIKEHAANELSRRELHDEQAEALLEIVKKKQAHKENILQMPAAEEPQEPQEVDVLEALKRSLAAHPGARSRHREGSARAGKPKRTARPASASKRTRTAKRAS